MYVLFKTVHGSKLYGLNHANSDDDFYTVVGKVKNKKATYSTHKIVGSEDSVVVDLGTWLGQCRKGVPQALEAMFSNMALEDHIPNLRAGYRASTGVYDTYLRTIKSFAFQEEYKTKRHAIRLAFNLRSIRDHGRFDPRLTERDRAVANTMAHFNSETVYDYAKAIAWS